MGERWIPALPALAMVALLVVCIAARPEVGAPPAQQDPAAALLARARAMRQAMHALPAEDLPEARLAVIAAFREVHRTYPQRAALAAEAAFRAGELLRAGGEHALARLEFRRVQELAPTHAFSARAGLELAHLERREGRLRTALEAYMHVAGAAHAEPQQRDEALLWAGRMQAERGRASEARELWERVAAAAEDPLDRVRAWDLLAQQLVAAGDLEGAAGVLAQARAKLARVALEATERGARVAGALERMRAVELLKAEVKKRLEGVLISR